MSTHIVNVRHPGFGELLADWLDRQGWSYSKFARAVDCDHSTISRYIRDERKPTRVQAIRISRALALSEDDAQRLLGTLGYLTPTYQRRLRAELWSEA